MHDRNALNHLRNPDHVKISIEKIHPSSRFRSYYTWTALYGSKAACGWTWTETRARVKAERAALVLVSGSTRTTYTIPLSDLDPKKKGQA